MFDRIYQTAGVMHQTGLAVSHREHLADPAGFKLARHQVKIRFLVQHIDDAFRLGIDENEILMAVTRFAEKHFIFRGAGTQKNVYPVYLIQLFH